MNTFLAKRGWKRMRKREIKIIVSFRSFPTRRVIENSKKIEKNPKNKKIPLWLHYKPKQVGERRDRAKIKIIVPFRSYQKRNRK